jgi:hypothetical protein
LIFADWFNDRSPPNLDVVEALEVSIGPDDLDEVRVDPQDLERALTLGRAYRVRLTI